MTIDKPIVIDFHWTSISIELNFFSLSIPIAWYLKSIAIEDWYQFLLSIIGWLCLVCKDLHVPYLYWGISQYTLKFDQYKTESYVKFVVSKHFWDTIKVLKEINIGHWIPILTL